MRLIKRNMAQIIALCEKHKVLELYVFGSVLTPRFGKDSDVDFTVVFDRKSLPLSVYVENYFAFKFALEDLLMRDVDLVEYNAIKNPYFKQELDETKQLIYAGTGLFMTTLPLQTMSCGKALSMTFPNCVKRLYP